MVRASRRDGASSKENSLNSNAAREAPTYGGAVQSNRFYQEYGPQTSAAPEKQRNTGASRTLPGSEIKNFATLEKQLEKGGF